MIPSPSGCDLNVPSYLPSNVSLQSLALKPYIRVHVKKSRHC
jgi:hypothetical protein